PGRQSPGLFRKPDPSEHPAAHRSLRESDFHRKPHPGFSQGPWLLSHGFHPQRPLCLLPDNAHSALHHSNPHGKPPSGPHKKWFQRPSLSFRPARRRRTGRSVPRFPLFSQEPELSPPSQVLHDPAELLPSPDPSASP